MLFVGPEFGISVNRSTLREKNSILLTFFIVGRWSRMTTRSSSTTERERQRRTRGKRKIISPLLASSRLVSPLLVSRRLQWRGESTMDLELRCPFCDHYYQSPVYLPCSHSLCYSCALASVQSVKSNEPSASSTLNLSFSSDLDQLSSHSDNDSGILLQRSSSSSCCLLCPVCSTALHFESIDQVKELPFNRLLNGILRTYLGESGVECSSHVDDQLGAIGQAAKQAKVSS